MQQEILCQRRHRMKIEVWVKGGKVCNRRYDVSGGAD